MDANHLLVELEALPHRARLRRLVELGRSSKEECLVVARAFAEHGETWVRTLAVATTYGTGDGALIVRLARDRSRLVRTRALAAVDRVCTDDEVVAVLESVVDRRARMRLAARLHARGRIVPLDRWIGALRIDDPVTLDVLPYASPAVVERALAMFGDRASLEAWSRLVRHHPALTVRVLVRAIDDAEDLAKNVSLMSLVGPVAQRLAKHAPTEALALAQHALPRFAPGWDFALRRALFHLLRTHPVEAFDVLRAAQDAEKPARAHGHFHGVRLDRVAHRLGAERLAWVFENAPASLNDGKHARRWLYRMSEPERTAVVEAWFEHGTGAWGSILFRHVPSDHPARESAYVRWSARASDADGAIALGLLRWLPLDLRRREAERHLRLPALATKPVQRNAYAELLPFADAKDVLASYLGHPEGAERAHAARALLGSVANDPSSIDAALEWVKARKHEQDPVRLAMLDALSQLPPSVFAPSVLPLVRHAVEAALDAADLSPGTPVAAERLVLRLFRVDAAWAASALALVVKTRGTIATHGLEAILRPSDVDALAPELAAILATWVTRERAPEIVGLARALGLRLVRVPALMSALETIAREIPLLHVASSALALLHRHAPARFAALVPQLLASDASFAIVPSITLHLSLHRQDLLAPFVANAPMQGRFASGRTTWAIDFSKGWERWTTALHRVHAATWCGLLSDRERDVPTIFRGIHVLAQLAYAAPDILFPFAKDERPPVREVALRALPWLDEGQGTPLLIEALGDERARIAIYALRKALAELDPKTVLGHLRAAPREKVTVLKEIVRLAGEVRTPEAHAFVLELEREPNLHRDVRVAALRALWDWLDEESTWPALEAAIDHPDWIVATKLVELPLDRVSAAADARLARLFAKLLARSEIEARLAVLSKAQFMRLADRERAFFEAVLARTHADVDDEACSAATAVFGRMTKEDLPRVIGRLRELMPRRRVIAKLQGALWMFAHGERKDVARELVAMLGADSRAVALHVRFAKVVFDANEMAAALAALATRGALHFDVMLEAQQAIAECDEADVIEDALAKHASPLARRLALEALVRMAAEEGWTEERRERLEAYRNDPSAEVAGKAEWMFPPLQLSTH